MIIDLITGSDTVVGNGNQIYDTDILYENQDVQTKIYIQNRLVEMSQNQVPTITNESGGDGRVRRITTKFVDVLSDGSLEYLVIREYLGLITDSEYYSVKKFVYTLTKQ